MLSTTMEFSTNDGSPSASCIAPGRIKAAGLTSGDMTEASDSGTALHMLRTSAMKYQRFRRSKTPVLILGNGLTALGVLRCFGRAGIPVYCASEELGVIVRSRWFRRMPAGRASISHPDQLAGFLGGLPWERTVLVPCADNWASAVARLPGRFAERFPVSQSNADTLDLLVDKSGFANLLVRLNIPHPETVHVESEEQLRSLDIEDFSGSFLKPCDSLAFFGFYERKAFRVESQDDAVQRYRRIHSDGFEVLFQEYIPGPASNHYFIDGFIDRNGHICAMVARQRLRMYPVDFGNSSYMVSIPVESVSGAAENLKRLLGAIDYRGIFSAEFKYDTRDRQFKILEINARPWWYVEFAAICGADVCSLAYRDALGRNLRPRRDYRTGVRSVHPYFDLYACLEQLRKKELTIAQWAGSWIGARLPVLCSDDPLPGLAWWIGRAWCKVVGSNDLENRLNL